MNIFIGEYNRYKTLLEKSCAQVSDADFFKPLGENGNSIAIIVNHLSGNFQSRFTDFLTSDGEKEWRNRDDEFEIHNATRSTLMEDWQKAWQVFESSVFSLNPDEMRKTIQIRRVDFTVEEALLRSLAHFSYHVGQVTFLAKHFAEDNWEYLSIAPGESQKYNQNPTKEKGFKSSK